jgi:ADP-ribosylglycohydrolase
MLGAIAGDIIGSVYEGHNMKRLDFPLFSPSCCFTDDTVLTVALADSILSGTPYVEKLKEYFRLYPRAGYGAAFKQWAASATCQPYNSFGNGSAMRVSPVGFAYQDLDTVRKQAARSAAVTHNHPEGIKGAEAVAAAIFLARQGENKAGIRTYIETEFGYDLSETIEQIRIWYKFDVTCQGSVSQAIIAFLDSTDFEDAIRKAISIGGDSDTIACMAGGIAQAYYHGIPEEIEDRVLRTLDRTLLDVVRRFEAIYPRDR